MFKESIKFALLSFAGISLYQLIANKDIRWIDNIAVCVATFLIMLIYNWSKVPYKWKKTKNHE